MGTRQLRAVSLALAAWVLAALAALRLGAVDDVSVEMIAQLRIPRMLLATAVGAGLSVSGAVLQALFANPLCEPYTLGISSGATFGAVLGITFGLGFVFGGLAGSAFIGSLFFALILYFIARRRSSGNLTLLLSGVMLSFLGSSLVALWMAVNDASGIQAAMFWLMGDLSHARINGALVSLAGVVVLVFLIWRRSRELDALLVGAEDALSLGVDVGRVRRQMVLLVAFLVGLCVSGSGMIGFVGLVVPHFVRRAVGSLHHWLLPLCALWGAVVLMVADVLSRFAVRPFELPVGVVTSLIGAPFFVWIMFGRRGTS